MGPEPSLGVGTAAVDARRRVRRGAAVPPRRPGRVPAGRPVGRRARERGGLAGERHAPEALLHDRDRGARADRADRHGSVALAQRPVDRFADGRGRPGRRRRLHDPRRRGPRPSVPTARRRVRRDDLAPADERGATARAARRRRARAADAAAGDPRRDRGDARRPVSARRRASASGDRANRRDGAAARRPAHALDGRGRRAGAPSGDRRSARRGRGRREGAARRRR